MRIAVPMLAGLMAAGLMASPGWGQKLCPGLTGTARTKCLENERARTQRQIDDANRKVRHIDQATSVVCTVTRSSIPGKVGGKIGDDIQGLNRPCTKRAR